MRGYEGYVDRGIRPEIPRDWLSVALVIGPGTWKAQQSSSQMLSSGETRMDQEYTCEDAEIDLAAVRKHCGYGDPTAAIAFSQIGNRLLVGMTPSDFVVRPQVAAFIFAGLSSLREWVFSSSYRPGTEVARAVFRPFDLDLKRRLHECNGYGGVSCPAKVDPQALWGLFHDEFLPVVAAVQAAGDAKTDLSFLWQRPVGCGESPRFKSAFTNRHVVLPVIHVESESQALRNAELALDAGSDGLFLINHSIDSETLLKIHASVANCFGDAWIGVNCLDLLPTDVFRRISERVAGVWADNAMIDESSDQQPYAQRILDARDVHSPRALYFGGVAFKYQRHVDDLVSAAKRAAEFMDVVTTSGPGTGQAAHVDKIRAMKQALGEFPLAIASGITPDNIGAYLPHSDCYLVATGIGKSFSEINRALLDRLITTVRGYDREPD